MWSSVLDYIVRFVVGAALVSGLDFLVDALSAGVRMDIPEEKGKAARAVVREIEKVPDPVARSEYLRRASAKLGVGEELLRNIVEHRVESNSPEETGLFCPAETLEKKLGVKIEVSPYAQVNGAIGAAFLAVSLELI